MTILNERLDAISDDLNSKPVNLALLRDMLLELVEIVRETLRIYGV